MEDEEVLVSGGGRDRQQSMTRDAKVDAKQKTILAVAVSLAFIFFFFGLIMVLLYASTPNVPENQYWPKLRDGVLGRYAKGSVAADHVLCSEIGRNILIKGGNAVDAAIAGILCLGVVGPMSSGLGGGFFMTVYNKTTKLCDSIDAREVAPAAASEHMFKGNVNGSKIGYKAMGVPGELHGLYTAYKHAGGGVPWADLVQPSIDLMDNGVPVSMGMAVCLRDEKQNILADRELSKAFVNPKTNDVYKLGDVMKGTRKTYRNMLRSLAQAADPIKIFYDGWIGDQLANELKNSGEAVMTREDIRNYKSIIRQQTEVIYTDLPNDLRICGPPPPSSSAVTQSVIKTLSQYTFDQSSRDGIIDSLHTYLEASKFGYAHRSELGDMAFVNTSLALAKKITGDEYIKSIKEKITSVAQPTQNYGGQFAFVNDKGTTNIAVIDGEGNSVVATTTVNLFFGARVASYATGLIWNSQMDDFSNPDAPNFYGYPPSPANYIKPGKRPMSSISPLIIFDKNGTVQLAVGGAGGSQIISGVSTITMRSLLLGWNVKESMDRPRLHNQLLPNVTQFEPDFPKEFVDLLSSRGHVMERTPALTQATAIRRNYNWLTANSDYRKGVESQPAGY